MLNRRREQLGPIAIDLGASRVKMVQLALRDGHPALHAWAELCPPAELDLGARDAWLRTAIAETLRQRGFRGRRVATALGPGEFELKNIRLPSMPLNEIQQAAVFEAEDRFGLTPEQAEFRTLVAGQVRQGNDTREEVIVLAARHDQIMRRLELFDAIGLDAIAIDVAPMATGRCFVRFLRRAEDAASVNVFLDVGWRGTSLTVTRGAEVCFAKLFDVGGETMARAVAARLDMPLAEAHSLRVRVLQASAGRRTDPRPAGIQSELIESVSDAIRPALDQLAREVHLCLRYFSVTFRGQRPDCLTFVGGEAREPTLIPVVADGLDIPCTVGDPLRGLDGTSALINRCGRSMQPAWAVAVGLALRNLVSAPSPTPPAGTNSEPRVHAEAAP